MSDVEVRVCKNCNKFFQTMTGHKLCQGCREELEQAFKRAKLYIRENPGAGVQQVSEALEIAPKQILQWVREDRLYFADNLKVQIPCLICGTMISSGKYCFKCSSELGTGMGPRGNAARDERSSKSNGLGNSSKTKKDYISISKKL